MYYTQQNGALVSGCSLSEVIRQLHKKPVFNHDYIQRYLWRGVYFFAPNDAETIFKDIYRVPFESKHSIALASIKPPDDKRTALQQFRQELLSAVQACIGGDKRVAVELSGGLDSSSVSALARAAIPNADIVAFTNGVPKYAHPSFQYFLHDESSQSQQVADTLGLKHVVIEDGFRFHEVIEKYTEILGTFSEVMFPVFNHRSYEIAQQMGISVLLSGFGGDEMVSQHAREFLIELKTKRKWVRFFYECLRARRFEPKPALPFIISKEHAALLRIPVPPIEIPFFSTVREFEHALVEGALSRHFSLRIETSKLIAQHYGIRNEFPLAHPPLMRFFHALPSSFKRRHGTGRYFMRLAMQPYLPKEIVWRQNKSGSTAPAAMAAFLTQLPQLFLERITPNHQGLLADYIDIPALVQCMEKSDGVPPELQRLCLMVMMFAHLEKWLKRISSG